MRQQRWLSAGATLALVIVAAACGDPAKPIVGVSPPPPAVTPEKASVSPAAFPSGGGSDPDQTCSAFVRALFSADTVHDRGPADAALRASQFVHPAAVARLVAVSEGRWASWVAHGAHLQTTVAPHHDAEPPAESPLVAFRAVTLAATPVGSDGWRGATESTIVYCTLGRAGTGWLVVDYAFGPRPPP